MDPALDFNHRPKAPGFAERVNGFVDGALVAEAAARPRRGYLGGSRLGDACARRLQYEFLGLPKDAGREDSGHDLRIFATGHIFEELAVSWLRMAGFDLRTRDRAGRQFGFSVAGGRIQGHIDGVIVAGPGGIATPALWECKSANARNWREIVRRGVRAAKPIYAAQVAVYQAYMRLANAPALFTVINKDTSELWHEPVPFDSALAQAASDKGVRILRACDAGEWLPRIATSPDHDPCVRCSWVGRCWS